MDRSGLYRIILCILLSSIAFAVYGQSLDVAGIVSDESGQPLPGVTVVEKGTLKGTSTDQDGSFLIAVGELPVTLVFSCIGYENVELQVSSDIPVAVIGQYKRVYFRHHQRYVRFESKQSAAIDHQAT